MDEDKALEIRAKMQTEAERKIQKILLQSSLSILEGVGILEKVKFQIIIAEWKK